jgi:hypothetical protein
MVERNAWSQDNTRSGPAHGWDQLTVGPEHISYMTEAAETTLQLASLKKAIVTPLHVHNIPAFASHHVQLDDYCPHQHIGNSYMT